MAISYVVDTYRGELVPASFARFAVFQAFFPHLVAGPIVRASELLPQLESPRDPRRVDTARAFVLILSGLFLKVVIANHLATHIVDEVFAAPDSHSSLEVLVGDLRLRRPDLRRLLRVHEHRDRDRAAARVRQFPQNFDSPYAAVSLQDFWRRWHMTLSRWLRDYLYIPLGGNRKGRLATYRNLMLTMLLGGLWHGAAWTFVIWGAIHGVGLCVERRARRGGRRRRRAQWLGRILTFQIVCFAWIFFRADSFARAGQILERLFTAWGQPSPLVTASVLAGDPVGIGGQYVRPGAVAAVIRGFGRMPTARAGGVHRRRGLPLIETLGPVGVPPFIYFRF